MTQLFNHRMAIVVMLLPLILLGLFILVASAQGINRFNPAFFEPEYVERYATPGSVARAMEGALQTGDQQLMFELQGTRRLQGFETSPKMVFTMLWEWRDRYVSYMYFDMDNFHRHMHYFEKVDERWVVSPTDWYYYWHSGAWQKVFLPVAVSWWVLGIAAIVVVWVFRISTRMREDLYGG